MLLHAERGAIVWFRCIGPYHIIALDARPFAVRLPELEDAGLGTELLLAVLRREDVFERVLVLAAPNAGTSAGAAGGGCSVAPRRAATGRQFAGSPSGTGITPIMPIGAWFRAVVATAARYVVAVAIGGRASRCGHYKLRYPSREKRISPRRYFASNRSGFVLFPFYSPSTQKTSKITNQNRLVLVLLANSVLFFLPFIRPRESISCHSSFFV